MLSTQDAHSLRALVVCVCFAVSVSAQSACASLPVTLNACGRSWSWTASSNSLYVLRCPATSVGLQGGNTLVATYGQSGNPDWRLCGDWDSGAVSDCQTGSNTIWFHRGGEGGPQLKPHTALTLSGRKAAVQFPYCA